jgi:tetratricopeptide (TPR) repeat protein
VKSAENKIADLKDTITTSRDKSKKELASKTAAAKQKKNKIEKDIAKTEANKKNLKKEFQHIMKKIRLLGQMKESVLADVKYRDEEISDLKKIIEREMIQISAAEGAGKAAAKPGKISESGLAGEAQNILSTMHEQIDTLKTKNAELEKLLTSTKGSELEAKRKADAEKALEQDTLRKTNKERLDMHYNLAVVYSKNGMYKDAEREYLKCLDIDPKDAGVHYNLGLLYDDKLNKNNKAMWHYKKYLQFVPKGNDTYKVRQWLTDIELETRLGAEAR